MRAICEVCSHPQPVDWKAGDLCIACGQPVRREVRCFWCAKWTPAGKFCRRCGAAVLEESLYGAARMLRDAGTDRFTIPKLITELDPEQVENFTRIYQRHAAVMHRHVDHVRFLEGFLQQHHWSEALEEELVVQLPWPEERLEKLSAAMGPETGGRAGDRAEDRRTAQAVRARSPFAVTQSLAAIAGLLLDDWSLVREVQGIFAGGDGPLRDEALLALTGWRVIFGPGLEDGYRELVRALRDSPMRVAAALRLAMLGDREAELPPDALLSKDPEVQFMAALAAGHNDTLIAALGSEDELKRFTAAQKLIDLGCAAVLAETLRSAAPEHQLRLLKAVAGRKRAVPELRETLYEIAGRTAERQIRQNAVRALCYECPPQEVERLAVAAQGESTSYQAMLQTAGLDTASLERLCAWFLEHGKFSAEQWGMRDVAKQGRMPADFVPRYWERADDAARIQLCRFAECQLEEYADEGLHRFLVGVAFGSDRAPVRSAVWTSLYRWYRRLDVSGSGQIFIRMDSIERFFGSVPEFVAVLTRFLRDPQLTAVMQEYSIHEQVSKLVRYTDDDVLPALAEIPEKVEALADAVTGVIAQTGLNFILRIECVGFLAWLGKVPELRSGMRARIAKFAGTDVDHAAKTALERMDSGR